MRRGSAGSGRAAAPAVLHTVLIRCTLEEREGGGGIFHGGIVRGPVRGSDGWRWGRFGRLKSADVSGARLLLPEG